MDVGGFAEPRKILCQSDLPSVEQLSVHPRSAHGGVGNPQQMQQLGKSTKIYMDKQNISSIKMSTDKQNIMSALQLLEIFERAGDGLDQLLPC